MTKVLIITYYWPPAGGAGVQRWVKLSKYLSQIGIQPIILTVDEQHASYMQVDHSLENDIGENVKVIKTKSFEPINLYAKMVGKGNVPTAGFSNVNNQRWSQRVINFIRSNFFIPDPRKGWNKYALREARRIIQEENITCVITSTPPHSSQLIGLQLKKQMNIHWIADMRDPWTDIYYFNEIGHSSYSRNISEKLEKEVLRQADNVITVSESLVQLFQSKDHKIDAKKFKIIPNGYDPEDFDGLTKTSTPFFNVVYTGSMSLQYSPDVFFDVLKESASGRPNISLKLTMVGEIDVQIKDKISQLAIDVEFVSTVPHAEVTRYQKNADLLLLVIPNVENAEGILTGKLFEYLASENAIIGLGPEQGDAAKIIRQCKSGEMYDRHQRKEMKDYLDLVFDQFEKQQGIQVDKHHIELYSRKKQAEDIHQLIMSLS